MAHGFEKIREICGFTEPLDGIHLLFKEDFRAGGGGIVRIDIRGTGSRHG